MLLEMRSVVTAVVLAAIALSVPPAGQSAFGKGGILITPSVPDQAQQPANSHPTVEDLRPSGPPIVLQSGRGTLLHLSAGARTVFVADPEVVDVQIAQQSDLIYVNAKKVGVTMLSATGNAGSILLNSVIEVKGGPVALIKGSALVVGVEPTPTPGSTFTQSTLTTPTGTEQRSTTSYRSTTTTGSNP
jgi:Flp pilus assembly secretin CpaC